MVHRRIPKKNRKKLKSVDPFNNKANAQRFQGVGKNKNNAPASLKEEQPLTKSLKHLISVDNPIHDKKAEKQKKKQKNAVLREAEAIGLKKGKFETVERFVKRIEGIMHNRVRENIAIAKHGLAGRKQEEIDADYKKIEESEKRRKEQEKREVENKIKEARKRKEELAERRLAVEKIKEKRLAEKRRLEEEEEAEEAEEKVESADDDSEEDSDDDGPSSSKKKKMGKKDEKKMVLSKKDRRKETLKNRKNDEKKGKVNDAIWNSKEVIAFGERYDAPPVFGGHLKKKFEPLMAKAGQKTLLLHSLLKKGDEKTEYLSDESKIQEERQRVIDAYREMKKSKSAAARDANR